MRIIDTIILIIVLLFLFVIWQIITILGEKPAPQILDEYKSFFDDRKASLGYVHDVKRLQQHGYKKYRYVSKSFIKRFERLVRDDEEREKHNKHIF
jgi:hypothetical protein